MANFNPLTIFLVWSKAEQNTFMDPTGKTYRHDCFGNIISLEAYGDRNHIFGWEIDHIVPSVIGGTDELSNLRPLHWRVNASHGGVLSSVALKKHS